MSGKASSGWAWGALGRSHLLACHEQKAKGEEDALAEREKTADSD
jgi:hypothetical protein